MIDPKLFFEKLLEEQIEFFTGVPDSLLKDICAYISENSKDENHVISANEGGAIGLAVGNYLATKKVPLVYMQNSGLGNAVNPILSIADEKVYGIPMILMVGWRGEPGYKDEPQHVKQGIVSENLLDAIGVTYQILDANSDYKEVIEKAKSDAISQGKPVAILVRKSTFSSYKVKNDTSNELELSRERAIEIILENTGNDIVVSTTGKTSREVFEIRESKSESHEKDFLTVGGMGHTSQIALGVALGAKDKDVYCLDGDGSVIMHMGSLATVGSLENVTNFKHIVLNNEVHDSVGGQATVASTLKFCDIAEGCGYTLVSEVKTEKELISILPKIASHKGRVFLEIKVLKGARENLGRPTTSTKENKEAFESFVQS